MAAPSPADSAVPEGGAVPSLGSPHARHATRDSRASAINPTASAATIASGSIRKMKLARVLGWIVRFGSAEVLQSPLGLEPECRDAGTSPRLVANGVLRVLHVLRL